MTRIRRILNGSASRVASIGRPLERALRLSALLGGFWAALNRIDARLGDAWDALFRRIYRRIPLPIRETLAETGLWMRESSPWYAASMTVHTVLLVGGLFAFGWLNPVFVKYIPPDDEVVIQPADTPSAPPGKVVIGDDDLGPHTLTDQDIVAPRIASYLPQHVDDSKVFEPAGGGERGDVPSLDTNAIDVGGFDIPADGPGPKQRGAGGIGKGSGEGDHPGIGGTGAGFGGRGKGSHNGNSGLIRGSERAVLAALLWFNHHRNGNGSWSMTRFATHCAGPGPVCDGAGNDDSDVSATSLSLLTFLAAGQTQSTACPYRDTVKQGIYWLMRQQKASGDTSGAGGIGRRGFGSGDMMYSHALATITLCEDYGMTRDITVGRAAQAAVHFIETAQILRTGGWRYVPQDPNGGDTSVFGWQIMALHSAQLAGLTVNPMTLQNARRWLESVQRGDYHGLSAYQPGHDPTPTMTAIGMLCWQYLGLRADDPRMIEAKQYVLGNLPDNGTRNTYYWYYATQGMHNFMGPDWDKWNRKMRRALIETQCRQGCATGSWSPSEPNLDAWSEAGGRIVTTAFSTLTLEVYYRYLPLYQMGGSPHDNTAANTIVVPTGAKSMPAR